MPPFNSFQVFACQFKPNEINQHWMGGNLIGKNFDVKRGKMINLGCGNDV